MRVIFPIWNSRIFVLLLFVIRKQTDLMRNLLAIKRLFGYLIVLGVMVLSLPLPAVAVSEFSFRTVTVSDGLSSNIINAIYKDERGFVWLGTQTGLDRFDGVHVTSFPQFAGQTILSLAETDSINLMIGTDKGLFRLDRRSEAVKSVQLSGQVVRVNALFSDTQADRLLVVTDHGLFVFHKGEMKRVLFEDNAFSSENQLSGIAKGKEDDVYWLTSQGGLIMYDAASGKSEVYHADAERQMGGSRLFSCLAPSGDRIYLGTRNAGMLCFDLKTKTFSGFPGMTGGDVKQIVIDESDMLYVGCNGGGIQVFNLSSGERVASLLHSQGGKSICSNAVYTLFKEKDLFFVGTYMGGFCYVPVRGSLFSVYSWKGSFDTHGLNLRTFYIDEEKGNKVIGTRDGLYFLSGKSGRVLRYTQKNSVLRSDIILFVAPFGEDYLVGAYRGGLYVLSSGSGNLSFFGEEDCFRTETFGGAAYDREGKVWIGSSSGLYEYDPQTRQYKLYNNRNSSLTRGSVYSVSADSRGRIWVGAGGALFMYNRQIGVFETDLFPEKILPYTKSVRYIYEDREHNLWFCDDKEGIVKADAGFTRFEHYTVDDFLPNNSVMSVAESPDGKGLWFATQDGLLYLDKETGARRIFSVYDGLPGYVFNYAVQVTSDGTVWWGNERGLVSYRKPDGKEGGHCGNACPPVITSISVAGKLQQAGSSLMPCSAPFTEEITLSGSENNIALDFSSLNYAEKNTMLYECCLEGYDGKWKTFSKGNQVSYTDLPAGSYLFKVRASSWPDAVRTLKVNVRPDYLLVMGIAVVLLVCVLVFLMVYTGVFRRLLPSKRTDGDVTLGDKQPDAHKEKYQKSKMDAETAADIEKKLHDCMAQEKLYLNPDLKLQDVASAVGYSVVEVSQTLNVFMNTNFTDFVNRYRVELFIRRMQERDASKYTLVSLSEECGFSSRTSFFRSFRKLKGMSPSEYMKTRGGKSAE